MPEFIYFIHKQSEMMIMIAAGEKALAGGSERDTSIMETPAEQGMMDWSGFSSGEIEMATILKINLAFGKCIVFTSTFWMKTFRKLKSEPLSALLLD